MHPTALLADIGDLAGEIIDTGALGVIAEGLFVQVRRAAGDDDAVQLVVLDRLDHRLLAGLRAHVDVFLGECDGILTGHLLGDSRHIDGGGNVGAAMADEYASALLAHVASPPLPWLNKFMPYS